MLGAPSRWTLVWNSPHSAFCIRGPFGYTVRALPTLPGGIRMSARPNDLFLDRTLPSNLDAERSVLGAILLDNRVCNQAMELLRRDDFYLDSHRKLFDRMVSLSEQGRAIDTLTLGEELRRNGEFE